MEKGFYVNAPQLMDLIECMQLATKNIQIRKALEEVQELILEQEWKEFENE